MDYDSRNSAVLDYISDNCTLNGADSCQGTRLMVKRDWQSARHMPPSTVGRVHVERGEPQSEYVEQGGCNPTPIYKVKATCHGQPAATIDRSTL